MFGDGLSVSATVICGQPGPDAVGHKPMLWVCRNPPRG